MKRFLLSLTTALLLSGGAAFADTDVLLDFDKLKTDVDTDKSSPYKKIYQEHPDTVIDYSSQAGTTFSEADKATMKTSLAVSNWLVSLASSAQTVENMNQTMIRQTPVEGTSKFKDFAGKTVLGIRVHFPTLMGVNSWALIKPPFDIPVYSTLMKKGDNGDVVPADANKIGKQFDAPSNAPAKGPGSKGGYGVLKNVGAIKEVQISVLGRNYPHSVSLILENDKGQEYTIFMGYMKFDGWRELRWVNPNYQGDVRNRALYASPLYPKSEPYVKIKGILIQKDGINDGGDFISYIKQVDVIYDKAMEDDRVVEVDDEKLWGILADREQNRRKFELSRIGTEQVLRSLEEKRMAKPTETFDPDKKAAASAAPAATTTTPTTATTPANP